MREILFKAKRLDNGEWVEGYYSFVEKMLCEENVHVIYPYNSGIYQWEKVDPEPVSQITGMTDKNGEKIWEGDKMEFDAYGLHYSGDVRIIGGNACIWCGNATPFLDDAVKRYGAVKTGNIHDKEGWT